MDQNTLKAAAAAGITKITLEVDVAKAMAPAELRNGQPVVAKVTTKDGNSHAYGNSPEEAVLRIADQVKRHGVTPSKDAKHTGVDPTEADRKAQDPKSDEAKAEARGPEEPATPQAAAKAKEPKA